MSSRDDYLFRYQAFNSSLKSDAILARDNTAVLHNKSAQLFRNGLAVVGFTSLEDFIKKRTSEALNTLSSLNLPFSSLPEKVRDACTIGSLKSIAFQAGLRKEKADKLAFIHDATLKVSSTQQTATPFQLYELAFGYEASNINKDTIRDILKAFMVSDPWNQIDLLSSRIGLGGRNLSNSFDNAAVSRHQAAHTVNADTPQLDLEDFLKDSVSIALGFDALLTMAIDEIKRKGSQAQNITANDVKLRFLKKDSQTWKEFVNTTTARAKKRHQVYDDALESCRQQIVSKSEFLIVLDASNKVITWKTHF